MYLGEAGGEYFQLIIHRGLNPRGLEMVHAGTGFTGKAARTRSFLAMRVEDLDDEQRTQLLAGKGFAVIICIPLITRDQVIGVMNLAAEEIIPLELAAIDLSMVMGNLVATATESVLQARELTDQARVLAEQKEAVQFFAYTACHDMKSPATGVHGLARMLAQRAGDSLDQKGRAIIDQIERAAQRIEDLASEVNAYIRAKEAPIKPEELELGELLAGIAGELSARAEAQGVELVFPSGQIHLKADRASLTRALTNLVDNALKYGGPGLSRVEVIYQRQKRPPRVQGHGRRGGSAPGPGREVLHPVQAGRDQPGHRGHRPGPGHRAHHRLPPRRPRLAGLHRPQGRLFLLFHGRGAARGRALLLEETGSESPAQTIPRDQKSIRSHARRQQAQESAQAKKQAPAQRQGARKQPGGSGRSGLLVGVDREHRHRGVAHHVLGHAAEDGVLQALAAVGGGDDQVDVVLGGVLDDLGRRLAADHVGGHGGEAREVVLDELLHLFLGPGLDIDLHLIQGRMGMKKLE